MYEGQHSPEGQYSPKRQYSLKNHVDTDKEKHTTWEVPKKRKTRWSEGLQCNFYDLSINDYFQKESRIPTTFNRFTVLQNSTDKRKNEDCNLQKKREDQKKPLLEENTFIFNSFDHFMKNIKNFSSSIFIENYSVFIKNNKNFLYSVYSLDSFYPNIDINLESNINVKNTNNNFEFLNSNNMIQVAGSGSKYDIEYFKNLNDAYKISKIFSDVRDYNSSRIKPVLDINKTNKQPYNSHIKNTETNKKNSWRAYSESTPL